MEENKKRKLPQSDLPYEVRMKYLIKDYIRIKNSVETLESYAKALEDAVRVRDATIDELSGELDLLKEMTEVNHIHEIPSRVRKWKKMVSDSEYSRMKEKYEKLAKRYRLLLKDTSY